MLRPEDGRVVFLLKDARLVADDDAIVANVLAHVRRVARPVVRHQQSAVA